MWSFGPNLNVNVRLNICSMFTYDLIKSSPKTSE